MADVPLADTIRNIDTRLSRVERLLPTLATRNEIHAAIAGAVAPLATPDEMHAAIAVAIGAAVAPLATREELRAEGEQARRHTTMLFEDLKDDNRIILEHLIAVSARVDAVARRSDA